MSSDEKQRIIESWEEHVKKHDIRSKFFSSSSTQEEKFDVDFKFNILQSRKLTQGEKLEIIQHAGL
ncbi:hypothetical protein H0N99_01335 [Candidatus Micrarchaeota archaeon]|nr:hypothetical protein [Candidatus Micrarchaeota archaeon]